ncbi:SARM1 protein, partial [Polyodon spathula]|nr:SARM1 protein [Polyodon spathula]
MFSSERLLVPEYVSRLQTRRSGPDPKAVSPGLSTDVRAALDAALPPLRAAIRTLKEAEETSNLGEIRQGIAQTFQLVQEAWVLPTVGRQVAEEICNIIRLEGALDLLLKLLQSPEVEIKYESTKLLEQILTSENRDRVARMGLGVILNLARERDDAQLARSVSGILEHMFKHTEETCSQLISNGALDSVLYWCRGTDPTVLRHCAMALANCAMYGGHACQRRMIEKQAAEWLFPLAFSKEDELIRFHACLAVAVLAANREVEGEVVRSGTLELVEPFIASLDPDEFARSLLDSSDNTQGRTAADLQHLLPLLDGARLEGKCIAAFYLCVETSIKSRQNNTKELQVDGDLLLNITDLELRIDLGMTAGLTRKRFLRELRELKTYANYSTCDPSNLADWLGGVDPRFRQYTYNLLQGGLERSSLPRVTEQQLQADCLVQNGLHRTKILVAAKELLQTPPPCSTCELQPEGPDVFISYRRTTGSQLASLLKVHLQVRGFSVFIDVEKLEAGKFEDKLIQSVQRARNFILVMSAGALDKCMGDSDMKDWVHKEIVTALNGGKNIVPVTDHFLWPEPSSLPEDMRAVLNFNGVKWSHEYQEATIEKIIRFLQGQPCRDRSSSPDSL